MILSFQCNSSNRIEPKTTLQIFLLSMASEEYNCFNAESHRFNYGNKLQLCFYINSIETKTLS
jgi:hypothetical protein